MYSFDALPGVDDEMRDRQALQSKTHLSLDFHQILHSPLFDAVGLLFPQAAAQRLPVRFKKDDVVGPVAMESEVIEGDQLFELYAAVGQGVTDAREKAPVGDHQAGAVGANDLFVVFGPVGEKE